MAKMYFPQYARGREGVEIVEGETVLQHIRRAGGVEIDSECGGRGTCGRDVIRVEGGGSALGDPTDAEKHRLRQGGLRRDQRLACQARVVDGSRDVRVFMPDFGRYTVLTDTLSTDVEVQPWVLASGGRVVDAEGGDLGPYGGRVLGLAVDVGTTTLVMQLVDLETGENVGKPMASKNPQIAYGNDVISRIGHTMDVQGGLEELQEVVVDGINRTLRELGGVQFGEDPFWQSVYDVVVVGNSTMRNVFFGRSVRDLGVIPFEAPDRNEVLVSAVSIGLDVHPRAWAYGPPIIGGHAGSDCLADIIATRLYESDRTGMIIDIGTNGEVVIGNRERLMTASCAAGGAYEGYQIRCGVGAIDGAITRIRIEDGRSVYETLGNKAPLGVCGSGVIDLLAEMRRNGIMNERARIAGEYRFADSIRISQEDINQLIMAKAGLRTDQDLLVRYFGTSVDRIDRIYLAGAFGNTMSIPNAKLIGLLPDVDEERFIRFGNGALAGARDMLLSRRRREDAVRIIGMTTHTKPNEIEGEEFQFMVADRMYFAGGSPAGS